jgi:hypothetical protein
VHSFKTLSAALAIQAEQASPKLGEGLQPMVSSSISVVGFPEHRLHGDERLRTQHRLAFEH